MKPNTPKWLMSILSVFGTGVCILMLTNAMTTVISDRESEEDWVDALTNAVMIERRSVGGHPGVRFEPYVEQLQVVRAQLRRGDEAATYAAMNRLMDMLENRENGIPAATADWLFDFCYVVTPARYHDVSRHIDKFIEHQYGERGG